MIPPEGLSPFPRTGGEGRAGLALRVHATRRGVADERLTSARADGTSSLPAGHFGSVLSMGLPNCPESAGIVMSPGPGRSPREGGLVKAPPQARPPPRLTITVMTRDPFRGEVAGG